MKVGAGADFLSRNKASGGTNQGITISNIVYIPAGKFVCINLRHANGNNRMLDGSECYFSVHRLS